MSEIAERLTGLNEVELREYEFTTVGSLADTSTFVECPARQNVRFATGRLVAGSDLEHEREMLRRPLESFLKK